MSDETAIAVREATAPLDVPVEIFKGALERRKANRAALMEWVKSALVEGTDFGSIETSRGPSKPSLRKPGAEKICGMLAVTVHFPNLAEYEQKALRGEEIKQIILRCELRDPSGRVLAEGVGARSLAQDKGDLNKALKMAAKSAHIDATLRMAGLSEVFTQDLEDMQANGATGEAPETRPAQDGSPVCPRCGHPLRLSKYGDSYLYCWKQKKPRAGEKNGCGAQWTKEEWEAEKRSHDELSAEVQEAVLATLNEPLDEERPSEEEPPSEREIDPLTLPRAELVKLISSAVLDAGDLVSDKQRTVFSANMRAAKSNDALMSVLDDVQRTVKLARTPMPKQAEIF